MRMWNFESRDDINKFLVLKLKKYLLLDRYKSLETTKISFGDKDSLNFSFCQLQEK